MALFAAVTLLGLVGIAASHSFETSCGMLDQSTCTQQRKGQALLQHYSQHGAIVPESQEHRPTAYVQVGSSGIGLPPQLAMWANGSAGLSQLQEKARAMKRMGTSPSDKTTIPFSQWIAETLLPQAQLTINQLNDEVDAAFEEESQCQEQKTSSEGGISDDIVQLTASEQRHSDCETTAEQEHREALQNCGALTDLCNGLAPPKPLKSMKGESSDDILTQLGVLQTYWDGKYKDFSEEKKACEKSQGIEADYAARCAQDKHNIENSYCALKKTKTNICSAYKGCFAEKIARFDKVMSDVKVLEGHVRANFKSIKCFNLEDDTTCDPESVDVSHLTVHSKDKPIEASCSTDLNTGWNYSQVRCPELEM